MHHSKVAAENEAAQGNGDNEIDTQELQGILNSVMIHSDPIGAEEVDERDEAREFLKQTAIATLSINQRIDKTEHLSGVDERFDKSRMVKPSIAAFATSSNTPPNEQRSSAKPSRAIHRTPDGRLRLISMADNEALFMRASQHGSTLSTTQENDPEVYNGIHSSAIADCHSTNASNPMRNVKQDGSNTMVSAKEATEHTLGENNTDYIHLSVNFSATSPLHFSASPQSGPPPNFDSQAQNDEAPHVDPITPAPPRPFFLQKNIAPLMGQSQLFDMTQASPASGFTPGPAIPSSARPSPDLYNLGRTADETSSSPLGRRDVEKPEKDAVDVFSSSPSTAFNAVVSKLPSSPVPNDHSLRAPTFPRRATEPRDIYVSVQSSQERKQHGISISQGSDSDDIDFDDKLIQKKNRVKAAKRRAIKHISVGTSSKPSSGESAVVEVPSTARSKRSRSIQEDYVAQCEGADGRDSQPGANVIVDSQGQAQDPASDGQAGDMSSPSNASTQDEDFEKEQPTPQHVLVPSNNRIQSLPSQRADSEASTQRLPSQALGQQNFHEVELKSPEPHRAKDFDDSDEVVPETSPPAKTFAEIEEEFPDHDEVLISSFKFTQDEIDREIFPQSQNHLPPAKPFKVPPKRTRDLAARAEPQVQADVSPCATPTSAASQSSRALSNLRTPSTTSSSLTPLLSSTPTNPGFSSPTAATEASTEEHLKDPTIEVPITNKAPAAQEIAVPTAISITGRVLRTADQLKGPSADLRRSDPIEIPQDDGSTSAGAEEGGDAKGAITDEQPAASSQMSESNVSMLKRQPGINRLGRQSQPKRIYGKGQKSRKPVRTKSNKTEPEIVVQSSSEPSEHPKQATNQVTSRTLRALAKTDQNILGTPISSPAGTKPPTRSSRRVAEHEKAQSVDLNKPSNPMTPSKQSRGFGSFNPKDKVGLFTNMAFCVSYVNRADEKQNVIRSITQQGGNVLESGFDELFEFSSSALTTPASVKNSRGNIAEEQSLMVKPAAIALGFVCLIADEHSRRIKYMQALALGFPCISGLWILHSVSKGKVLPWEPYVLAAGKSDFLGGAVRSRMLPSYDAGSAKLVSTFESRPRLLQGKRIILVMGKGKVEAAKKPYFFLTQALGPDSVKRVLNNGEARKALLETEGSDDAWDWVYIDSEKSEEKRKEAEKTIFSVPNRKRKRTSMSENLEETETETEAPDPKKVRLISDEYIIQSLIFGGLMED